MNTDFGRDWGLVSESYDVIKSFIDGRDLSKENEAQTRFDVIDRVIREILGWTHGQIKVEERALQTNVTYVDYILRSKDYTIIVEAKRAGAAFPNPTRKKQLKLSSSASLNTGRHLKNIFI